MTGRKTIPRQALSEIPERDQRCGEDEKMERVTGEALRQRERIVLEELKSTLVGPSDDLLQVRKRIFEASLCDANVLILGATGTGKEIVASKTHELWSRNRGTKKPMVAIASPGFNEAQWEAELFGAKKGAAPDVDDRDGVFKEADGTTLFLDEIGDIPSSLQPKLFRAIETKRFRPVGGKETGSNFRLICATDQAIAPGMKGRKVDFREELYYRLAEITIQLPPLRKRREDIIPIFIHLLRQHVPCPTEDKYRLGNVELYYLLLNDWGGNVREIETLITGGKSRVDICGRLSAIFEPKGRDVLDFVCSDTEKRGWPHPKGWEGPELDLVELAENVEFESDRCWESPAFPVLGVNVKNTEAFEASIKDLLELDRGLPVASTSVGSDMTGREEETRGLHPALSETAEPSIGDRTTLENLAAKPVSLDEVEKLYLEEVLRQHRIEKGKHGKSLNWLAGELGRKYETLKKMIENLEKRKPNQN